MASWLDSVEELARDWPERPSGELVSEETSYLEPRWRVRALNRSL